MSLRRFEREVRSLRKIQHTNVMPVLDEDMAHQPPWFVMPKAESNLAATDLKKDVDSVLSVFGEVLDGIQAIHTAGCTHRDIKPANMLRMHGGHVVVSDLGLVKHSMRDTTTLTATLEFLGTPQYCAPEQFLPAGTRDADARTDVYQLGKLLYEMLTGLAPALIDPSQVPDGLSHIIQRATREAPDKRFESVAAFRDALQAYAASRDPNARPVETFEALNLKIQSELDRGEYRADDLKALCSVIANLNPQPPRMTVDMFTEINNTILGLMAKEFSEDLAPALTKFADAVKAGIIDYPYSFAETVAGKMRIIFSAAEDAALKALAIRAAMHAAVGLHRFAAMSIFDSMLSAKMTDDCALAIQDALIPHEDEFKTLAKRYSPEQLHPIIRRWWESVK